MAINATAHVSITYGEVLDDQTRRANGSWRSLVGGDPGWMRHDRDVAHSATNTVPDCGADACDHCGTKPDAGAGPDRGTKSRAYPARDRSS